MGLVGVLNECWEMGNYWLWGGVKLIVWEGLVNWGELNGVDCIVEEWEEIVCFVVFFVIVDLIVFLVFFFVWWIFFLFFLFIVSLCLMYLFMVF